MARHAADFGVRIDGPIAVDMKRVKARKDAIVRDSNEGVRKWLESTPGVTVIRGQARFEAAKRLRVGEEAIAAERIFVNVGGRAVVPSIPGLAATAYRTNSSMMDVDFLPEHLIVLGGSYVGLEFAQMYARFGSRVTVIEKGPKLVAREDEWVSDAIRRLLESEGIAVQTAAEVVRTAPDGSGVLVQLAGGHEIRGSDLLIAIGRVPNTHDLGLDRAGVSVDDKGYIQVDDRLQTNVPGIWALGDCNGKGAFTHTSYNDHEIVAANLLQGDTRLVSDRIPAYALFIDPPLGRAGLAERAVRKAGKKALVCELPMTRVGRAKERGETFGSMRILVDQESKRILGASLLGIEADEVVHVVLDVMYAKAPFTVIQRAMHIHPTVAEFLPTMLADLRPLD